MKILRKCCLFATMFVLSMNLSYAAQIFIGAEVGPSAPPANMVWVSGHWSHGYWVPGGYVAYAAPVAPGAVFVEGGFGGDYHWHHGHWGGWNHRHG